MLHPEPLLLTLTGPYPDMTDSEVEEWLHLAGLVEDVLPPLPDLAVDWIREGF